MKNLKTKLNTGLFLIAILGIVFSPAVFPASTASAMTCNSATLDGTVDTGGVTTQAWFEWGQGSSLNNVTVKQTFTHSGTYSQYISGLTENTTYSMRAMASNKFGNYVGQVLTFTTPSCGGGTSDPTVTLTADQTNINYNSSTTVRWNSSNATSCSASGGSNGWSGSKNLSGSFGTGALTGNTTYNITCSNSTGSANASVTVSVNGNNNQRPTVSIYASPSSVVYGGSSTITWNSNNADSCNASGGTNGWYGYKNLSGTFYTGNLNGNTSFSINCTNNYGSAYDSVTVYVNNIVNPIYPIYPIYNNPTVTLTADSRNVAYNGATTIRWTTTNATYCNASGGSIGWAGTKSIGPGSFYTGSLTNTQTYSITCTNNVGTASDTVTVNVGGQVINNVITRTTTTRAPATSLVLVTSSVDRNRPIVPTLDNTNPCPGDEINYSITYQNIGTSSITGLVLRVDLPAEVTFLSATPVNPTVSGKSVIFNLGTLGANKSGTVTIRVHVQENVSAGAPLNFPAVLSYVDPSGNPNSVNANVSANVCGAATSGGNVNLGALVFGAGFLPTSIVGWLLLIILILILILLAKYVFSQSFQNRKTVTVVEQPTGVGKKTTTTTTL